VTVLERGSPASSGMNAERIGLARERCAQWVEDGDTPSLCVCVARHGQIVLHECWGAQGPNRGPLRLDSLFPIMSMTKPVTATLAMQLVDDGVLGLNRPARDYLPELAGDGVDDILVHHLLTHTAGYPAFPSIETQERRNKRLTGGFEIEPCPEGQHPLIHELLAITWDDPRVVAPGELMMYGNHSYQLLGEIVRRLSGRPIDALARERVFGPLGMDDSSYGLAEAETARLVLRPEHFPHAVGPSRWMAGLNSIEGLRVPYPTHGIVSTPRDMTAFGQMILNRGRYGDARILSPAAVAAMTRDQIPGLKAQLGPFVARWASWGYGFAVESPQKWPFYNGGVVPLGTLCHPGAGGAMLWIDPEHDIVGTYFEVTKLISHFDHFINIITAAAED